MYFNSLSDCINKYVNAICAFCSVTYIKSEVIFTKMCLQETGYSINQLHRKLKPAEKTLSTSPGPSKLMKGNFRESDYESDYDGRTSSCYTASPKFSVVDSGITY